MEEVEKKVQVERGLDYLVPNDVHPICRLREGHTVERRKAGVRDEKKDDNVKVGLQRIVDANNQVLVPALLFFTISLLILTTFYFFARLVEVRLHLVQLSLLRCGDDIGFRTALILYVVLLTFICQGVHVLFTQRIVVFTAQNVC